MDRTAVVLGHGVDAQRGSLGDGAGAAEGAKEVVATTSVDVAVETSGTDHGFMPSIPSPQNRTKNRGLSPVVVCPLLL